MPFLLPYLNFLPVGSDAPIARTTPALPGLFALATLWAGEILKHGWQTRCVAWYAKSHPTVSDALTSGRATLWSVSFETPCGGRRGLRSTGPGAL